MTYLESLTPVEGPSLFFPREEFDRRIARTRELMADQWLDVLVISNCSNIGYLTGYDTTMPSGYARLIVPREGELHVHCSEVEAPSILLTSIVPNDRIQLFGWTEAQTTGDDLAKLMAKLGYDGKKVGLEMGVAENFATGALDARSYRALVGELPNAEFIDATLLVLEARVIKSASEIEYMRKAGTLTWAGLKAGLDAVAEGVSENAVAAAVYAGLAGAGSQASSIDPMVVSGPRTGWMPHVAYDNKLIQSGDPVYFEVTGTYRRYNAPSMRTTVVGEPSDDIRRLADANLETITQLLQAIRPGRTGHDISMEVKAPLAGVPGQWFHGGYGYSIGMGFQPTWTEAPVYISEGSERVLEPGMTFHLAVCSMVPSLFGVGFSESILITEDGCECITPNQDFFLKIS
jgi:Xaa-Pro dipeptidase